MFSRKIEEYFRGESERFVLICGCARSGTTLLFNYFNEFEDVFLLNEDFAFIAGKGAQFRSSYNKRCAVDRGVKSKGYYIPACDREDGYWFDSYYEISKRYKYFGTKLAFGPEAPWDIVDWYGVEYFHANFSDGLYVLPIRRPLEGIHSMSKMFGGADFGTLKNVWIKSVQFQIMLFGTMKRAFIYFSEDLDLNLLQQIGQKAGPLGLSSKTEGFVTGNSNRPSHIGEMIPDHLAPYAGQLQEMEKAYAFLRKDIDRDGVVNGWVHKQELCRSMWHALEALRADENAVFSLS